MLEPSYRIDGGSMNWSCDVSGEIKWDEGGGGTALMCIFFVGLMFKGIQNLEFFVIKPWMSTLIKEEKNLFNLLIGFNTVTVISQNNLKVSFLKFGLREIDNGD